MKSPTQATCNAAAICRPPNRKRFDSQPRRQPPDLHGRDRPAHSTRTPTPQIRLTAAQHIPSGSDRHSAQNPGHHYASRCPRGAAHLPSRPRASQSTPTHFTSSLRLPRSGREPSRRHQPKTSCAIGTHRAQPPAAQINGPSAAAPTLPHFRSRSMARHFLSEVTSGLP